MTRAQAQQSLTRLVAASKLLDAAILAVGEVLEALPPERPALAARLFVVSPEGECTEVRR